MRKLAILLLLFVASSVQADPADAVVRIAVLMDRVPDGRGGWKQTRSCGSGTVVNVANGKSMILTVAHLWSDSQENPDPRAYTRSIVLDVPAPASGRQGEAKVGVRLCALDYRQDLAVIEVNAELPFVCKVAPLGTHARNLLSAGYDHASEFPGVRALATPLGTSSGWTWTREIPREGRSGGALIDQDKGLLVGVCHGYQCELNGTNARGMYVPLASVWNFLETHAGAPTSAKRGDIVDPFGSDSRAPVKPPAYNPPLSFAQPYGAGQCPPSG